MLNVEKTYVVHYTRLPERRMYMDSFLRPNDISVEYITSDDQDELSNELIKEYYNPSKEEYDKKILGLYGSDSNKFRFLSRAEISCTIKHYNALDKVSKECKEYGLIFEDDIMFVDNFVNHFNTNLSKTPDDWDAIFFGGCCGMDIEQVAKTHNEVAYLKSHPASKCADGYLIRSSLAKKITKTMKPFTTISDWELSYQLFLHDATVYWWSPPLIAQGSEHGIFKSTLR